MDQRQKTQNQVRLAIQLKLLISKFNELLQLSLHGPDIDPTHSNKHLNQNSVAYVQFGT